MKKYISILTLTVLLASCSCKDIVYFQDRFDRTFVEAPNSQPFKLKPGDQVTINVKSRNNELAQLFNMGGSGYIDYTTNGGNMMTMNTTQNNMPSYTIDDDGNIDFPILGKINIMGKNRMEVAETVANLLKESGQVEDAVVTVQYINLYVNVLGEMGAKRQSITQDKYTVIDLLTENDMDFSGGKRRNIAIIRDSCGVKKAYKLDITNLQSVYESPVYYVHPGDLVYAEPRKLKVRSTAANGNVWVSYSFWLGLPSIALSLFAIFKK